MQSSQRELLFYSLAASFWCIAIVFYALKLFNKKIDDITSYGKFQTQKKSSLLYPVSNQFGWTTFYFVGFCWNALLLYSSIKVHHLFTFIIMIVIIIIIIIINVIVIISSSTSSSSHISSIPKFSGSLHMELHWIQYNTITDWVIIGTCVTKLSRNYSLIIQYL